MKITILLLWLLMAGVGCARKRVVPDVPPPSRVLNCRPTGETTYACDLAPGSWTFGDVYFGDVDAKSDKSGAVVIAVPEGKKEIER